MKWNDDDFDGYDDGNSTFDPEYYWIAINSESGAIINPIIRSIKEWNWVNTQMTKDDILDTVLYIKKIKEVK